MSDFKNDRFREEEDELPARCIDCDEVTEDDSDLCKPCAIKRIDEF